ncbi:hypothetical protein [Streptomyces sp. NBC_00658]|uniref:hypothetical protein n=1 Tax=Streptomyces sp. NBC_00658 TaxID=2975800 RepID=UPI00325255AC
MRRHHSWKACGPAAAYNRGRRWWGDLYELCPDDLLAELNGGADPARITALMKRYRAQKR